MSAVPFGIFDADNHSYEPRDIQPPSRSTLRRSRRESRERFRQGRRGIQDTSAEARIAWRHLIFSSIPPSRTTAGRPLP